MNSYAYVHLIVSIFCVKMSEINSDTNQILREDVEKALLSHEGPNASLISYSAKGLTAKGENFASEIVRVMLKYSKDGEELRTSFVVKIALDTQLMKNLMKLSFEKERTFYEEFFIRK